MDRNDVQQRQHVTNYGYRDIVIGVPLIAVATLCLVAVIIGVVRGAGDIKSALILMIIGGVVGFPGFRLAGKARKGIKLRNRVRLYGGLINDQGKRSIDSIASDLGRTDIEQVMDEIQELIDLEFLLGVTLYRSRRILADTSDIGEISNTIFRFPSWNKREDERKFLNRAGRILLRALATQDLPAIRLLFGEPDAQPGQDNLSEDQMDGINGGDASGMVWTAKTESNLTAFFPQLLVLVVAIENGKLNRAAFCVQGGKLTCEMSLLDGPEQQFNFVAA